MSSGKTSTRAGGRKSTRRDVGTVKQLAAPSAQEKKQTMCGFLSKGKAQTITNHAVRTVWRKGQTKEK